MLVGVCSYVHEGYLTRAAIHKELCNQTANEVSLPRPFMALVITSPPHSKAAVWKKNFTQNTPLNCNTY